MTLIIISISISESRLFGWKERRLFTPAVERFVVPQFTRSPVVLHRTSELALAVFSVNSRHGVGNYNGNDALKCARMS